MSTLAQLTHVPNLGPLSAIEKLVENAQEAAQGSEKTLPTTTFFLKSGLSLRGQVLAFSDDSGPRSVVMLTQGGPEQSDDLSYVLLSEIAGLTVHNAVNLIERLSDGRLTKPMATTPNSAELLKLARGAIDEINVLTEGKMTLEIQDSGTSHSPELQQGLYLTLRDLYSVLKKMAGEELGKRSLHVQAFQFLIRAGDAASVQIKRNSCTITVGVTSDGIERVSRDSLRAYLDEGM